jgi:hypothetical protein
VQGVPASFCHVFFLLHRLRQSIKVANVLKPFGTTLEGLANQKNAR